MNEVTVLGTKVRRNEEGLFCLNDLHAAAGASKSKGPSKFFANQSTKELVEFLEAETGKKVVQTSRTGEDKGTYVSEDLVMSYAMWTSPRMQTEVHSILKEIARTGSYSRDVWYFLTDAIDAVLPKLEDAHLPASFYKNSSEKHRLRALHNNPGFDDCLMRVNGISVVKEAAIGQAVAAILDDDARECFSREAHEYLREQMRQSIYWFTKAEILAAGEAVEAQLPERSYSEETYNDVRFKLWLHVRDNRVAKTGYLRIS